MPVRFDQLMTGTPWDLLHEAFGSSSQWTYRRWLEDGTSTDTLLDVLPKENVPDSPDAGRQTYQLRVVVKTDDLPAEPTRGDYLVEPGTGTIYVVDDFEALLKSGLTRLFLVRAQDRV